jgi:hypothetical protein
MLPTFFISPSNNICFNRDDKQGEKDEKTAYVGLSHPFCGNPDYVNGSFAVFFPTIKQAKRKVAPTLLIFMHQSIN